MLWIISCQVWLLLLSGQSLAGRSNLTVVNDIWNAFRAVTNDSALLDNIIPEMYGQTMRNTNPTFVFKMPTSQRNGFHLLRMRRSDFANPIFPNITRRPVIPPEIETDAPTYYVKSSLDLAQADEWHQLGLDGWSGDLKGPFPSLEQDHTHSNVQIETSSELLPTYPHEEIILDFKGHSIDGRVTDIHIIDSNQEPKLQRKQVMSGRHVYIARANNPFGYSMKWAMSNETKLPPAPESSDRGKRDVAKLYSMIKCSTGCDPLIYKGYGCYCGFGGHGVPVDGIDRCCRIHDKCYSQTNCISYLEYFVPYVWKCYRGKPLCAIDHGEWGGPNSCADRLCQCDLRLSRCLREFYCPNRRSVCRSSRRRRLQNLFFFD